MGYKYNLDLAERNYRSAVKSHGQLISRCLDILEEGSDSIGLVGLRDKLETAMYKVSQSFYRLTTPKQCIDEFRHCEVQTQSIMQGFTLAIRSSKSNASHRSYRSRSSSHSSHGNSSRGSKHPSSKHSSSASMKAEAAVKAATLRTQLKFHDAEAEQMTQLSKLRLLRDLQVEEAKMAALQAVEEPNSEPTEVLVNHNGTQPGDNASRLLKPITVHNPGADRPTNPAYNLSTGILLIQ